MLRSFSRSLALILVFSFSTALPVLSQQLDPTFGNNGLVLTNFPPPASPLFTITRYAVQSFPLGNDILTVAQVSDQTPKLPPSIGIRLLRYANDGTYLGTIGSEDNFVAVDAVRQPGGRIVVVGYTFGIYSASGLGEPNWKIVSFNQNGTHDTSFNMTGVVVRGFAQNDDRINSVALQPDGKILVVGTSANSANGTVTIVGRYNADGSVDAAFGPYGEGFFDIYDGGNLSKRVLVTPGGKILLGGSTLTDASDRNLVILQYNANGTLDTTFGNQGASVILHNGSESFYDFALQSDSRIIVLASSTNGFQSAPNYIEQLLMVVRLTANGAPDPIFGNLAGRVLINTSPALNSAPGNYEPAGSETPLRIFSEGFNGDILFTAVSRQVLTTRRDVLMVFRINSSGRITGRSFTRRTPASQAISNVPNNQMNGLVKDSNGKILVSGGLPALPQGLQVALVRFSALSAVNNANHFLDYNFDGRAEFAVYRPNNAGQGLWLFLKSHTMQAGAEYQFDSREYGAPGDIPAPGDYDGDSVQDLAVFRPATGEWITRQIYLNNCAAMDCAETIQFGVSGDIPAPGDFDGDGRTDRAVFRPAEGNWYILLSTGGYNAFHFGQNGDKPVTGDYDGDGKSDAAVIRRENGKIFWYLVQSSNNQFVTFQFGNSEDKTAIADYNGDGRTEVAVWRPSNGTFYVLSNYTDFSFFQLGSNGDVPIPADFDGDKKDDFAVYTQVSGAHTFVRSSDGTVGGTQFGLATDIPIAAAYVR
jgi:uncharacterized delta-60 repeat protein